MPNFICPNCGNRSLGAERTAGFTQRARGCEKCGFGFLFELLDDYYPAPNAAFIICDAQARVIGLGKGVRELQKPVTVHAEGDRPEPATADIFPAYDDDGGLLLVLTPN